MEHSSQIKDQIQRCRRLARTITDEDVRQSLEQLARDYEVQLVEASASTDDAALQES